MKNGANDSWDGSLILNEVGKKVMYKWRGKLFSSTSLLSSKEKLLKTRLPKNDFFKLKILIFKGMVNSLLYFY